MHAAFSLERGKHFIGFEEHLDTHLEDFQVNCEGQHVPDDQKVRLLRLSLADDALKVYPEFIGEKGMIWTQTENVFYKHFNVEEKQNEISNELSAIRFFDIRSKTASDRQDLDKVISRTRLAPLAKNHDQDDEA